MMDDVLKRIVELIREDVELHTAIILLIQAETEAKMALAEWRRRRK